MVARGLLANPAMFSGYEFTPAECIRDWVDISLSYGTSFTCFHNHLIYMLEKVTTKAEKRLFNALQSTPAVLEYLQLQVYPELDSSVPAPRTVADIECDLVARLKAVDVKDKSEF